MELRVAIYRILFVAYLLSAVCSAVDEHERTKNEIKEDIDYKTSVSSTWTPQIDNRITTASKDKGLNAKPTVPTIDYTEASAKGKKRTKEIDPIDQYLLDELLDIVDEKFTTLSKRLSTLERGVHSIQYYNVRSFRVINTHLHAVDTTLHGLNRQIDHVDQQNKKFEVGIDSIRTEMQDLQSLNTGLFQAIEQNLVHFHKDMQSRLAEMKGDMDKANKAISEVKNDTTELRADTENVANIQTDTLINTEKSMVMISDVAKGTLFLLNLTEHVQQDINENVVPQTLKAEQAMKTMNESISKLSFDTLEIRNGLSTFFTNVTLDDESRQNLFSRSNINENGQYKESRVDASLSHETCNKMIKLFEDRLKNFTQVNDQNKPVTCSPNVIGGMSFRNQSRKLMRALSTVNDNIYQSVTLYKHTGSLIERVIHDAELIASDQLKLRDDLRAYLLNGTLELFNDSLSSDLLEFVNLNKNIEKSEFVEEKQNECNVPVEVINEITKMSYNGTQIIELLTDLATTSTSAMQLSISRLEGEIDRLHKSQEPTLNNHVFKKLENFTRDDPKIGANEYMKDLMNRTDWIYQLTEAIASNTGWIPYLFHNMRFVESQVNKTLKLTNDLVAMTEEMSTKQQVQSSSVFTPNKVLTSELIKSQSNLNKMIRNLKEVIEDENAERSKQNCGKQQPEVTGRPDLTNQSFIMADMMEFVHGTSVKLNRLIPALTNLLGEPEPYIALLNGSSDKEGRVEIYYKGQWGTIPGPITHVEASYICRRLGYLGGNAVGSGAFGPGSGVFWNLNVTCLRTRWCSAVRHVIEPQAYSHVNDVGVVCDHMIRLEPNEDDIELSRHTGKLEIYHENAWRPVCHDGWGRPETDVVCRQLGFREGAADPVKDDNLVNSQWLTNVTCEGGVDRLDLCKSGGFVHAGCPSSSYVSMICS